MSALDEVHTLIEQRIALGDSAPEEGHAAIDELTERVVRATAAGDPDARGAAVLVAGLLDHEDQQKWTRWYA